MVGGGKWKNTTKNHYTRIHLGVVNKRPLLRVSVYTSHVNAIFGLMETCCEKLELSWLSLLSLQAPGRFDSIDYCRWTVDLFVTYAGLSQSKRRDFVHVLERLISAAHSILLTREQRKQIQLRLVHTWAHLAWATPPWRPVWPTCQKRLWNSELTRVRTDSARTLPHRL